MENDEKLTVSLRIFVCVVLGLSVLYWAAFQIAPLLDVELPADLLGTLRGFGPTIAAVVALVYVGGIGAIRSLLASILDWRVSGRLYAVALLAPATAMALALAIAYSNEPNAFSLGDVNPLRLAAIFFILPIFDGPLGEEPGWRGFFLPALMQRHSSIVASLLVGLVWYLWHLPHYLVDGRSMDGDFLTRYLVYTMALSLAHTWLFKKTGGSVLLHVLFHNTTNYVVLLSVMLFPAIREDMVSDNYFYSMLALGALAALSLLLQDWSAKAKNV